MPPNPRDDPYGIGLVAARPASGYAPVVRPPLTGSHPASLATDVVHHLLKGSRFDPNATPDLETALQPTSRGSFLDQVKGQLAPFDPRKPENWVDWAAMFVPGAKGGRFEGRMTGAQRMILSKLGNVQGGTEGVPYALKPTTWKFDRGNAVLPPDVQALFDHLGHPSGNPIKELKYQTGHNEAMAGSKLGTGTGGEVPSWVNTKDDLSLWKLYGHDPSHQAALEGLSDEQRFVLSQILDSISRRQLPPGSQHGKLGEPGSN